MRWNHLPVAGGIYDQHPKLLEQWRVIFEKRAEEEERQRRREENKSKNKARVAGRRR
jgi:hypothetical protein